MWKGWAKHRFNIDCNELCPILFSIGESVKKYRCTIKVVDQRVQVSAVAKTKKRARNAAAKRALEILNSVHVTGGVDQQPTDMKEILN